MNDFIAKNKVNDPFLKWDVICCEPHIKLPLPLLEKYKATHPNEVKHTEAAIKTNETLARVTEIARENNVWIGVYSGTPLAPDYMHIDRVGDFCDLVHERRSTCSNLDWRSTPEFCWSLYNNYFMTDSPNLAYHFLEAQPPIPYPQTLPGGTYDNMEISGATKWISHRFTGGSNDHGYYNSYKFNSYDSKSSTFPPFRYVNSNYRDQFRQNIALTLLNPKISLPTTGKTSLLMKKGQSLKARYFFGFQPANSHEFCLTLWIRYDESNKTFDIFNATDASGRLIYALKSVDGRLVWTRNTSMCASDFKNYDYVLNQGCNFDQGSGWYFLCVNMGSSFCRVGLGKPKPMSYVSDVFDADYVSGKENVSRKQDLKNMTIAYCWLGTATQHFETITESYIGDPKGENNPPTEISEFRVYSGPTTLYNMFKFFSLSKNAIYNTGK